MKSVRWCEQYGGDDLDTSDRAVAPRYAEVAEGLVRANHRDLQEVRRVGWKTFLGEKKSRTSAPRIGKAAVWVVLALVLSAVHVRAQSAVEYLSPNGNDSFSGESPNHAKATLQAALDALPVGGGIVYVAPGTYANTNAVSTKPGVSIVGEGQVGFGWAGGPGPGTPVFESSSGATLTIGTPSKITDPGWKISGVWFVNGPSGQSTYGLHVQRMRDPTLRDVVSSNYHMNGAVALYLDGTPGGWVEWAQLSNVLWANCSHALVLNNASGTTLDGGIFGLSVEFPGSVAIEELGQSGTLRIFGASINEYDTGVYLHSSEGGEVEAAQIYGLRVENHKNLQGSVGIRVSSGFNVIRGEFWGVGTGVLLDATSINNKVLGCTFPHVLNVPVENLGFGNLVAD